MAEKTVKTDEGQEDNTRIDISRIELSLETIEIPVDVYNPVTKETENYILVEADEDTAVKFKDHQAASIKFSGDGVPVGIQGANNQEPLLLAGCLFKITKEGNREKVKPETIRKWPARIVKVLFERAKQISELDDTKPAKKKADEDAKNAQSDTQAGSA